MWAWRTVHGARIPDGEEGDAPAGDVPVANLPVCTPTSGSTDSLGWVRVSAITPFRQPPREGATVTLGDDVAVFDKVLGKEEICRLPKGTQVTIPRGSVRRRGLWVSLAPDGFELPGP
jgi:hypothetical protein